MSAVSCKHPLTRPRAGPSNSACTMSRGRILLLEDDPALRGLLLEVLGLEDFQVITCESYEEIRLSAASGRGDLVVADFWGGTERVLSDSGRDQIRDLANLQPVILLT